VTLDGRDDASEESEGDMGSEELKLRAERQEILAQTRAGIDYASARLTFINGQQGIPVPDMRQSHAATAAAAFRDSGS
jgi:hypothetical protein